MLEINVYVANPVDNNVYLSTSIARVSNENKIVHHMYPSNDFLRKIKRNRDREKKRE